MLHLEDLYLNGPVNRIPAGMTEEECEEYLQTKEGARFSERELFVEWIATPQGRRYPTTLLRLASELGIEREQFVIWCAEASFPRELFWKILLKGWCSNLASIPEVFEKRVRANDLHSGRGRLAPDG